MIVKPLALCCNDTLKTSVLGGISQLLKLHGGLALVCNRVAHSQQSGDGIEEPAGTEVRGAKALVCATLSTFCHCVVRRCITSSSGGLGPKASAT